MNDHLSLAQQVTGARTPSDCLIRFKQSKLAAAISLVLGLGIAPIVFAQTAPGAQQQKTEEVVITGTRIRGAGPVGSNVVSLSTKEISQTGLVTSTELLRSVPQVSNLGLDDSRTGGAQRAVSNLYAASGVNLRGLGVEATLALVDGRRPVRSGEGRIFDMNSIPAIVLQRVEVVPDGASAIYGSDAVTGVVNLVPFHSYDGATVRANYGSADGLHQYTFSALGGHSWDTGSVVLAYEHYKRSNLQANTRPDLYNDSISTAGAIGTSTNSSPGNITVAGVNRPIIDSNNDGRISAAEYAADIANPTANRQSNWKGVDALPEQKRDGFFGYAEQELTDRLKLYVEGYYTKRNFARLSAAPGQAITVPASNFYNQSGVVTPLTVAYSFINDVGNTKGIGFEKSRLITAGLKYDLGNQWQAEGFYTYGKTENYRRNGQQINNAALTTALGLNTAAAFSPFGAGSVSPQSTIDSFNGFATNHTYIKLNNASVKADGPIFKLPGGDVRVATGLEYLKEERPQENSSTASNTSVSIEDISIFPTNTRRVDSAYVELLIPIIGTDNAFAGVKRLSFSAAIRRDHYKDTVPGSTLLDTSTNNPKFGVTWQPVDDVKIRASYGKSFRAPSLGDLSLGAPTFAAAGPYAFVPHAAGLFGLPNGPVAALAIQGGRVDGGLTPERAKTTSIGMDFTPAAVPGLNLGVTYYRMEYKNQIQTPADSTTFNNPAYASALAAAGLAIPNPTTAQVLSFYDYGSGLNQRVGPPRFLLYGTGSTPVGPQSVPIFLLVDSRSYNGGLVKTSGWDFSFRYTMNSSVGTWTFADTFTYVSDFRQSLLPGTPLIGYLNTVSYPIRFSTRAQIGWEKNGLNANVFVNYANSYTNTQVNPNVGIASNTTVDASLSYDTGSSNTAYGLNNLRVQLNAQNLFDRKPPYALINNPAQTFDTQNASAMGRLVSLTIEKKF